MRRRFFALRGNDLGHPPTTTGHRPGLSGMPAVCQPYANARELLRTSADSYGHYFPFLSGIRLTHGVLNLTRNEQVSGSSPLVGSPTSGRPDPSLQRAVFS